MILFRRYLPVALTIAIGWVVLLSFLAPGLVVPFVGVTLADVRPILVEWAMILAAFALVLGFINLLSVHVRRVRQGQGVVYSVILIGGALFTVGLWLGRIMTTMATEGISFQAAMQDTVISNALFDWVIAPAQAALGVLLAIVLAVAGFRALRVRRTAGMILFLISALVVVLTQPAIPLLKPILDPVRGALIDPITTGSLRGLLIGVAIGGAAVGLRLLVGADKPQSD